MRLRNKILFSMLPLIVIPFILAALLVYYFLIRVGELAAEEESGRNISETLADLKGSLDSARDDLEILRKAPVVIDALNDPGSVPKAEAAGLALRLFFDRNPYYLEMSLTDAQGTEKIKFSRLSASAPPGSLRQEEFFLRTLITGSVQLPVRTVRQDRKVTILADRVMDPEFLGAIVLVLNTEIFESSLRPLLANRGFSALLFDDRGIVFADSMASALEDQCLGNLNLKAEAATILKSPNDEFFRRDPAAGCTVKIYPAAAFSRSVLEPQAGENWFLAVISANEAGLSLFHLLFFSILGLAVAGVLVGATAVARRITVPLEKFELAAKKMSQGELEIDLEVRSGDEVGDLAAAFESMARDLREHQERLVQSAKLATIGEIASELSHEIQNRVSAISLWLEYLETEIDREDPRREYTDEMKRSLDGFIGMLSSLKSYYKIPLIEPRPIDQTQLIEEVLDIAARQIESRMLEVAVDLSPEIGEFEADRELVVGVLLNLVLNAVEATPEGGEISIGSRVVDGSIAFSVRDTGYGIADRDLERIFYPFYSTKAGGSGLGLAVVSNLVSAHSGRVSVKSTPGHGSEFTVVLPFRAVSESSGGANGEDPSS